MKIENSKIQVGYLYENYKYIGENNLSLAKFIQEYSICDDIKTYEKDENYIVEINTNNFNKKLYMNKKNFNPIKLEIQNTTQNNKIYILYNEIKINNLQEDDILAFKLEITKDDI